VENESSRGQLNKINEEQWKQLSIRVSDVYEQRFIYKLMWGLGLGGLDIATNR